MSISNFYCTRCGKKGIPIPRKNNKQREPGHLKKLYCVFCRMETNHVEVRGFGGYSKEDFDIEFKYNNFDQQGNRKEPNYKVFKMAVLKKQQKELINNG